MLHRAQPGPARPSRRALAAVEIGHLDEHVPARPRAARHLAQEAGDVGDVLDHVQRRDRVVGALGQVGVLERGDVHVDAVGGARMLGGLGHQLEALHAPAAPREHRGELAGPAADVEQRPGPAGHPL